MSRLLDELIEAVERAERDAAEEAAYAQIAQREFERRIYRQCDDEDRREFLERQQSERPGIEERYR